MKREYIITSSARTMLTKDNPEQVYHLIFITDQSRIQEFNQKLNLEALCGYHAYKIAEAAAPGKDLLFTTKILVELQFPSKTEAQVVKELLSEQGITAHLKEDLRKAGKLVAFDKGDHFSNLSF